ncbi:MAG: hypothetical protein V1837_03135 [Candidatus Woesearchaeota archaeon]
MTDVSKNIILVLLVMIILTSVIGTWAFITNVNTLQRQAQTPIKQQINMPPAVDGQIELFIQPVQPPPTTQAEINLEIKKP